MSAERNAFVTTQMDPEGEIWILDRSGREEMLDTSAAPPIGGLFAHLAWAGDSLLYAARAGDQRGVWAADTLNSGHGAELWVRNASEPSASEDGSVIIYRARGTNSANTLWKANRAGREVSQVAANALHLVIHPTGEQAIFVQRADDGLMTPWRVALDGGMPEEIAHVNARNPDISNDGLLLAFASTRAGDDGVPRNGITYCELRNCSATIRDLEAPGLPQQGTPIRWNPDDTGVAYVSAENIWIQPLNGRARWLTQFTDGRTIRGFAWSPKSRKLAVLRERTRTDIVLFKGVLTRRDVRSTP